MNRLSDENASHKLYNVQFFDKRSRLCHNMCMEHFEMHKEQLEDLLIDVEKFGPRIIVDIPEKSHDYNNAITLDDFALIDELSGLNDYLENFMKIQGMSETVKARIRARMVVYSGDRPKDIAMQELRIKLYGDQR